MKRAWRIWLAYGLCLALALPALAWLSVVALELERAEDLASRNVEREKQIRLASWRIDTKLMGLVAAESARPYADYSLLLNLDRDARPMSSRPSDYVTAYFQSSGQGVSLSPQPWTEQELRKPNPMRRSIDERQLLATAFRELEPPALAAPPDVPVLADSRPLNQPPLSQAELNQSARNQGADRQDEGLEDLFAEQTQAPQLAQDRGTVKKSATPNEDFNRRQQLLTANTKQVAEQRASVQAPEPAANSVREGVSAPLWIGADLVLARRVRVGDQEIIQGSWLAWDKLRTELAAEVADLLPQVAFAPLDPRTADYGHALAALPIQLVVPELAEPAAGWTPLQVGLAAAWIGLLIAAAAVGALLWGALALAERRQAFVSAVTHELRTPLTTFRLYSEMLDGPMLVDEAKRKTYIRTLRTEADRLWHLVENVLAYARLERGRATSQSQQLTLADFWSRAEPRLAERATAAGMTLASHIDSATAATRIVTDPMAVGQILFNLVDNACKYAAPATDRRLEVSARVAGAGVTLFVRDHGPGVAPDVARRLFRPFSKSAAQAATSAPGVGLGLALSRRLARQLGGDLRYEPTSGGASFSLSLPVSTAT